MQNLLLRTQHRGSDQSTHVGIQAPRIPASASDISSQRRGKTTAVSRPGQTTIGNFLLYASCHLFCRSTIRKVAAGILRSLVIEKKAAPDVTPAQGRSHEYVVHEYKTRRGIT